MPLQVPPEDHLHLVVRHVVIGPPGLLDVHHLALAGRVGIVGDEAFAQRDDRIQRRRRLCEVLPGDGEIAHRGNGALGGGALHQIGFDGLEVGGELVRVAGGHRLHLPLTHLGDDRGADEVAAEPDAGTDQQRRRDHRERKFLRNPELESKCHKYPSSRGRDASGEDVPGWTADMAPVTR